MPSNPLSWLGIIIILAALSSPSSVAAQNQNAAPRNVLFILFDPTILPLGDEKGRDQWIKKELRNFYLKIPENTSVSVYVIDRGMTNSGPIYEQYFEFRREFRGQRNHQEALQMSFDGDLSKKLTDEWKKAHNNIKNPTSCLFSALHAQQRHINVYSSSKDHYDFYLLVLSDMLESCDEWGSLINFEKEKGVQELHKIDTEKIIVNINLSKIKKAIFIQVPHRKFATPLENAELEDFWKKFLSKVKIRPENLYYGSRFPINPPWSK